MKGKYHVELENDGCANCGKDKFWVIVDPDGIAGGTSYSQEDDAEDIAALMNAAFEAGSKPNALAKEFLETMNRFGNWDDGCFYYNGKSASEFQPLMRLAESASRS